MAPEWLYIAHTMERNVGKQIAEYDELPTSEKCGDACTYTPETLAEKFEKYLVWVRENPRRSYKTTKKGTILADIDRPLTLVSFCQFSGITMNTFRAYERRGEAMRVQCTRVRERIEADQLEGALSGQYSQAIVARVLKLADVSEVVNKSESDRIAEMSDEELQNEIEKLKAR